MIEVTYHRKYSRLTVKGHAMTAPKGEDLVCAAASILARTLAANAAQFNSEGMLKSCHIRLDDGDAEITAEPRNRYRAAVQMALEAVIVGFEILAQGAPGVVEYTIMG